MPPAVEARPTIDRDWLERTARADPLPHAFALWDLDRTPQAVRFVSAVRAEETVGYLLLWLGRRDRPVVHWFGPASLAPVFLPAFPAPPFLAVVPVEAEPAVAAAFPGCQSVPVKMMVRAPIRSERTARGVRRLDGSDRSELAALAAAHREADLAAYGGLDPEVEPTWGAFDAGRLVGVARAAVRLPFLWVIGGVFVEPAWRGRGLGSGLVTAVVEAAAVGGAPTGLYVRDEPPAARRLYERLGFREIDRRAWVDVRTRGTG
jgi:GNAT superfamily N-acetyltransferase